MSRGSRRTIARRIRIKSCDDESARCSASSQPDLPSTFSACTPPFTTISTFSGTSSPDRRCGSSEPKRQRNGRTPLQRRELWPGLAPSEPTLVAVTKPLGWVAGGNRAGGIRQRLHDVDGLAAQGRVFLLFARCKEGVEIEEQ